MCSVSAVLDYGRQNIPMPQYPPVTPLPSQPAPWTRETFDEFKEILERLKALDEKLAQPDCEDPAKQEWMAEVEDRLRSLEDKDGTC